MNTEPHFAYLELESHSIEDIPKIIDIKSESTVIGRLGDVSVCCFNPIFI